MEQTPIEWEGHHAIMHCPDFALFAYFGNMSPRWRNTSLPSLNPKYCACLTEQCLGYWPSLMGFCCHTDSINETQHFSCSIWDPDPSSLLNQHVLKWATSGPAITLSMLLVDTIKSWASLPWVKIDEAATTQVMPQTLHDLSSLLVMNHVGRQLEPRQVWSKMEIHWGL